MVCVVEVLPAVLKRVEERRIVSTEVTDLVVGSNILVAVRETVVTEYPTSVKLEPFRNSATIVVVALSDVATSTDTTRIDDLTMLTTVLRDSFTTTSCELEL